MARTPSALTVYLIAAGYRPPVPAPESFKRHFGERLWIHIADPKASVTVPTLLSRLAEVRDDDIDAILSGETIPDHQPSAKLVDTPRERASEIRQVLQAEAPSVAVFIGLDVAPAFLYGLREAGVRTILVASPTGCNVSAPSRLVSRSTFRLFDKILATNEAVRGTLVKLGAISSQIDVIGRLDDNIPPSPVDTDRQEQLAQILGGRPVWFASGIDPSEIRAVLDAQRQANGLSHRMLLVIAPHTLKDSETIAAAAEVRGYNVARRSDGEEPEDHFQ
ncbi:MAG: hypothetical protein AAGO57_08820, partial [Pseudomonadota bacterium]